MEIWQILVCAGIVIAGCLVLVEGLLNFWSAFDKFNNWPTDDVLVGLCYTAVACVVFGAGFFVASL